MEDAGGGGGGFSEEKDLWDLDQTSFKNRECPKKKRKRLKRKNKLKKVTQEKRSNNVNRRGMTGKRFDRARHSSGLKKRRRDDEAKESIRKRT